MTTLPEPPSLFPPAYPGRTRRSMLTREQRRALAMLVVAVASPTAAYVDERVAVPTSWRRRATGSFELVLNRQTIAGLERRGLVSTRPALSITPAGFHAAYELASCA